MCESGSVVALSGVGLVLWVGGRRWIGGCAQGGFGWVEEALGCCFCWGVEEGSCRC